MATVGNVLSEHLEEFGLEVLLLYEVVSRSKSKDYESYVCFLSKFTRHLSFLSKEVVFTSSGWLCRDLDNFSSYAFYFVIFSLCLMFNN